MLIATISLKSIDSKAFSRLFPDELPLAVHSLVPSPYSLVPSACISPTRPVPLFPVHRPLSPEFSFAPFAHNQVPPAHNQTVHSKQPKNRRPALCPLSTETREQSAVNSELRTLNLQLPPPLGTHFR
jgi:hypothetical protein